MKSNRFVTLSLVLFFLFSLLIAKFYVIQIKEGSKWEEMARRQHFFVVQEPFQRGAIWSNTEVKKKHHTPDCRFVYDLQKYHLFIDPVAIPKNNQPYILEKLRNQLPSLTHLEEEFAKKSRSRKLAMWLDRNEREAINSWWLPYCKKEKIPRNALYFVKDYQRCYPFKHLLGQVLHTVQSLKDEKTLQAFPTGGLELSLNPYLKGKLGKRLMKRSPRHAFETGEVIQTPENGADVYLTINHILQQIVEQELEKGMLDSGAKRGWAVMMDPFSGDILALGQYPFFSPSDYAAYFNDPEKILDTQVMAVTAALEPGSVMKPFTLAVALQANHELRKRGEPPLFDPEEKMATSDGRFVGRSKLLKDVRLHHFLNMNMALQKSSNIYMARLMERVVDRLGNQWYRNLLSQSFGFGKKTGIELFGESPGVLPTPGRLHQNGRLEWSQATPYSLAMGYNLQSNSIQLMRAFAVLANGGKLVTPTLIKKIVTKEGVIEPPREHVQVLDKGVAQEVVTAMRYVLKTVSSRADVKGYTGAGKSGTINKLIDGKYSEKHHVASFVGFFPAIHPAFILYVCLDEPECKVIPGAGRNYFGSVSAAPIFSRITKRSLEYLGVAKDDAEGVAWKSQSNQLQEKYQKWNNS